MSQSTSTLISKLNPQSQSQQQPAHSTSATTTSQFNDVACLTFDHLDQLKVLNDINHPSAGASVLFTGSTRDSFKGKKVSRLEYEAYTSLAIKTLHQILIRARSKTWPPPPYSSSSSSTSKISINALPSSSSSTTTTQTQTQTQDQNQTQDEVEVEGSEAEDPQEIITKIIIHHRLGSVPISEASILVAVSSPHRRKAFQVAEWCLEEVKKDVQIWKKEFYTQEEETREGVIGLVKNLVKGDGDGKEDSSWKSNVES